MAEKVETRRQLDACRELGFDLYQGYLLSRPEIVEGQALSPRKLTCLRIIEKLCDPATSAGEIETIVQSDVALSYRFLRVAGTGAARGLFRRLSSVRDAVVLLGQRRLRAWVTLMLLDGAQEGSNERLSIAMTRARMAELMAEPLGPSMADSAYTVGLVSALDLLLHASLTHIVEGLSLSSELEDALLGHTGAARRRPGRRAGLGGRRREFPRAFRYPARRARAVLRAGARLGQRGVRGTEPGDGARRPPGRLTWCEAGEPSDLDGARLFGPF